MTATSAVTLRRMLSDLFPKPDAIEDLVAKGHAVVIMGKDVRRLVDRIMNPYEAIPDASRRLRLFLVIVPGLAYANMTRELDQTSFDMLMNMGVDLGEVADEHTDENSYPSWSMIKGVPDPSIELVVHVTNTTNPTINTPHMYQKQFRQAIVMADSGMYTNYVSVSTGSTNVCEVPVVGRHNYELSSGDTLVVTCSDSSIRGDLFFSIPTPRR